MKANKNRFIKIILLTSLLSVSSIYINETYAIGNNPAFSKSADSKKAQVKLDQEVFNSVHSQLGTIIPLTQKSYLSTPLSKSLSTNYSDIDYPSLHKTKQGIDENGSIDVKSLKKPISQTEKVELADFLRYYYYSFTDSPKFKPLTEDSEVASSLNNESDSKKLNYFQYVTLINTIKDNPKLSQRDKNKRLIQVEADLQNSINILYGNIGSINDSVQDLQAWGDNRQVQIPFNNGIYSYTQLLAAYKKDSSINSVLAFYSSLLDTLYDIKMYSVQTRLNPNNAKVDVKSHTDDISKKYAKVDKTTIQPMIKVIKAKNKSTDDTTAADDWETNKLGQLGLADDTNK